MIEKLFSPEYFSEHLSYESWNFFYVSLEGEFRSKLKKLGLQQLY